jgi:hypothetical protein
MTLIVLILIALGKAKNSNLWVGQQPGGIFSEHKAAGYPW